MKKVLVITYYWPPAGGPGVQRWLKFISYLRDFGMEPFLYIPENPHYPVEDNTLLAQVPENVRTYSLKISEPMQWAGRFLKKDVKRISSGVITAEKQGLLERVLLWVRGNFFIPDARVLWVKPSVTYLGELLERETIDMLITTGPPHSLHLIGLALKKKYGIKWVADFRDPWTSIGYHDKLKLGRSARKKHRQLERMVLNAADKVIVTSMTTASEFGQITKKPIVVVTNGYDPNIYAVDPPPVEPGFVISHIGSMLSGRNPVALWHVLGEMIAENVRFREQFCLRLVGVVSPDVLQSLKKYGLEPYLEQVAYVAHSEAVRYQQTSQLLLLVEIDSEDTRGILPGKLFEYIAARRPILAIGPAGWEAGDIIRETGAGAVFNHQDTDKIREELNSWFRQFMEGTLKHNGGNIEKYSRRELTRKLASELQWE